MMTTRPPKTIVKPTALGPVANTDTKLLIYGLFQKGRVLAQDGDVLIVDEFGFDRIEREECPQAAHLLYKIIASRHQIRSTILVTNVDFDAWAEYLGDAPLAMAMLDRLVDGSIIIKLKGPSYRASRSANMNQ